MLEGFYLLDGLVAPLLKLLDCRLHFDGIFFQLSKSGTLLRDLGRELLIDGLEFVLR